MSLTATKGSVPSPVLSSVPTPASADHSGSLTPVRIGGLSEGSRIARLHSPLMPRTNSVRHLSSHGATAFNLQAPLTTDKCSTPEVNAIEGSAVALLAYQIQRLDNLAQSVVVLTLDKRTHG